MKFRLRRLNPFFVLVTVLAGCYSYKPVPECVDGDNFTGLSFDSKRYIPVDCEVLTLKMAQEIAVANNPDYLAVQQSMNAAWARYYASLSAYLPTVTGKYGIGDDRTYPQRRDGYAPGTAPERNYSYTNSIGVQGQWLLFDGLVRTMNALAARAEARGEEAMTEDSHRLLLKSVANAFNNVMLSYEQVRIAESDLSFQKKMQDESQLKYEAGASALTDVLNFEVRVSTAENQLLIAQYKCRSYKYILAELMGITDSSIPEGVRFPSISDTEPELLTDLGVYLDTALHNRPDLDAYREALKAARYSLYARWGAFSPKVFFDFGYQYDWNRTRYRSSDNTTNYGGSNFNYGGSVDWVLFEGGRRFADVREAQALVARSEYNLTSNWIRVIAEVRQSVDDCSRTARQLRIFQNIQKLVSKQRDLVEEEYAAGNVGVTRLNSAQNDLVTAESNLASSIINVLNAKAQLEAAIGYQ